MRSVLLFAIVLAALPARAQTPGTCTPGTATAQLSTPDALATLANTGILFFGPGIPEPGYRVPRASDVSTVFAGALWVGGRVGSDVRVAAARYASPHFWPGPLGVGATLPNPADCSAYDRIYVVTPADVATYQSTGVAAADLAAWPVGLGAPAVTAVGQPVFVSSRTQTLNLAAGERPVLGGGPTAFWVVNDVGNVHRYPTGDDVSAPLGIEVQTTAFLPETGAAALRQATVYRVRVVNRSSVAIDDLRVGWFLDADLGDSTDDYTGTDASRGLAYVYNSRATDLRTSTPPAIGLDLISGLSTATYMINGAADATTDPSATATYDNRLHGLWSDGTPMRALGNGYAQPTSAPTTVLPFTGDPVAGQPWSEVAPGAGLAALAAGDRRFASVAAPVRLSPGAAQTVDAAIVFAQGASHLGSVTALRAASDAVQAAYADGSLFAGTVGAAAVAAPSTVAPADGAVFVDAGVTFEWMPVAGADAYELEFSPTDSFDAVSFVLTTQTPVTLSPQQFRANAASPFYWRVRARAGTRIGPPSVPRRLVAYRYQASVLTLASGVRAYVETTAPGGVPACGGPSDPDEGCAEVGGDLVFGSPNSTGDYVLASNAPDAPAAFGPSDFEIRFTAGGSFAYVATTGTVRITRIPFELWDVGTVAPGAVNDPADDRRLVPYLTSVPSELCQFDYDLATRTGNGPATPFVRGYYPAAGFTYANFAAEAGPLVAADPAGCPSGTAAQATSRFFSTTAAPLMSVFFEQSGIRAFTELTGSTVRVYTTDRVVADEASPAAASGLRLGTPFPNPARGALTVEVAAPVAGRLRLVDVLGRTVLEQTLDAGVRDVRIDTQRLAPGAYALVLDAGTARATRTVTVVR